MADVHVRFGGPDPDTARCARMALQPVLDTVYRTHRTRPRPEIEDILKRAGRGTFSRDRIERFAGYIARGDRPVLIGNE